MHASLMIIPTFMYIDISVIVFDRAISVLLGDTWKKMGIEERRAYTQEAKLLAEQQKRMHPDCWKRKRSVSTGVCINHIIIHSIETQRNPFSPQENIKAVRDSYRLTEVDWL